MTSGKVILKLLQYIGKFKERITLLIILSLAGVLFEVLKPLPVKYIIDNVLSNQPLPAFLNNFFATLGIGSGKLQILLVLIGALLFLILAGAAFSIMVSHMTTRVCQRLVHNLSLDLFDKVQRLSLSFYSKNRTGELLQRMSGDVYVVYAMVAQILLPVITSLASLIAMFYIMAKINLLLAFIAISVVPALGLLLFFFNKPMTSSTIQQYNSLGQMSAFMQQSLSSIKIIQAYTREKFTHKKFRDHSKQYSHAFVNSTKISVTYVILTGVITGIAGAVVIGVGAFKQINGSISIGDLFVFLGYISALFGPVNSLSTTISTVVTLSARGKRIFEILESKEVVYEKPDAADLKDVKGEIELQDVRFGYDEKKIILKDFNLHVSPGQVIAVVGPTGAGKTSMISLLLRFYDPLSGRILIDGKDISDVTLHSLRNNISLVLQDSFLFPMSIGDNISFGNPEAGEEEIIKAAKAAQAHDFIMKLENGYNSQVSEGGVSLSGGEKQRISLARAFLRNAPILILDEPTSALDVQTESKIFKALTEYAKGKTVFIISHRLSTISHADLILTIKDGVIIEKGSHEELLKKNKHYAELYHHPFSIT